jgi:hypothetical protein
MNIASFFTGWNLMRILRLIMGVIGAAQAIELRDPLIGLIAAFFLYQALANVSCCGVGACSTTPSRNFKKTDMVDTTYEEVK